MARSRSEFWWTPEDRRSWGCRRGRRGPGGRRTEGVGEGSVRRTREAGLGPLRGRGGPGPRTEDVESSVLDTVGLKKLRERESDVVDVRS